MAGKTEKGKVAAAAGWWPQQLVGRTEREESASGMVQRVGKRDGGRPEEEKKTKKKKKNKKQRQGATVAGELETWERKEEEAEEIATAAKGLLLAGQCRGKGRREGLLSRPEPN